MLRLARLIATAEIQLVLMHTRPGQTGGAWLHSIWNGRGVMAMGSDLGHSCSGVPGFVVPHP